MRMMLLRLMKMMWETPRAQKICKKEWVSEGDGWPHLCGIFLNDYNRRPSMASLVANARDVELILYVIVNMGLEIWKGIVRDHAFVMIHIKFRSCLWIMISPWKVLNLNLSGFVISRWFMRSSCMSRSFPLLNTMELERYSHICMRVRLLFVETQLGLIY